MSALPYQLLPDLNSEEFDELWIDINLNGVRVPIEVDEDGNVLDGHHRKSIAGMLGVECPERVVVGLTENEKRAHALAVNIHRRGLSREQKRELLAAVIKAEPQKSDRQHAASVGVDHKTAASVRSSLQGRGEIPHATERTDSLGRQQPATKPVSVMSIERASTATKTQHMANPDTGEILPGTSGASAADVARPAPAVSFQGIRVPPRRMTDEEKREHRIAKFSFDVGFSISCLSPLAVYPDRRDQVATELRLDGCAVPITNQIIDEAIASLLFIKEVHREALL